MTNPYVEFFVRSCCMAWDDLFCDLTNFVGREGASCITVTAHLGVISENEYLTLNSINLLADLGQRFIIWAISLINYHAIQTRKYECITREYYGN